MKKTVESPEAVEIAVDDTDDAIVALAADTLRGDVRDAMLSWFKATPKPWSQMSEHEQRDMGYAADRAATTMVKEACKIIAAAERTCIVAKLTEYKEKDGVEAKLKLASKGEIVAALHEACGREVLIITSGAEEFDGQAGDPEVDADQPAFPALDADAAEALADQASK